MNLVNLSKVTHFRNKEYNPIISESLRNILNGKQDAEIIMFNYKSTSTEIAVMNLISKEHHQKQS